MKSESVVVTRLTEVEREKLAKYAAAEGRSVASMTRIVIKDWLSTKG